jgi:MoaA/NifB/PqqE/SkfB family radical SAM enzyme
VRQLRKINYSKTITIHRYNEPFADFPYALKRIRALKHSLPNSRLEISTNGDYLNKERLVELSESLTERDSVHITLHFTKQDKDYEKRKEELRKIVQGLDVIHSGYHETNVKTSTWLTFGQKCKIEYRVINFWAATATQMITDRGETLSELKAIKSRTLPCFTTVSQMQIEHDGSLQPCCNIHSSVKSHDKFSLGKLDANSNLFLTYCSASYTKWRKSMISFKEKGTPCSSCTDATPHDGKDSVANRLRIEFFKIKAKF